MSMSGSTTRSLDRKRSISSPCSTGSACAMPSRWLTSEPAPEPRRGDPDAHVPHVVDDLGDGEEVGGEAVVGDDVQLVVHPLPVLPAAVVAAQHHARRRAGGQRPLGGAAAGADQVRLGEVDAAHAEVVLGVDQALGGRGLRLVEQPQGGLAAESRGLHDPLGRLPHGALVLQPGLAGVQPFGRVDRDQPAGGVQHVGDRAETSLAFAVWKVTAPAASAAMPAPAMTARRLGMRRCFNSRPPVGGRRRGGCGDLAGPEGVRPRGWSTEKPRPRRLNAAYSSERHREHTRSTSGRACDNGRAPPMS
ncbi:hypothetical protein SALBM217S_04590 [Streptomyces griseoloalbus]